MSNGLTAILVLALSVLVVLIVVGYVTGYIGRECEEKTCDECETCPPIPKLTSYCPANADITPINSCTADATEWTDDCKNILRDAIASRFSSSDSRFNGYPLYWAGIQRIQNSLTAPAEQGGRGFTIQDMYNDRITDDDIEQTMSTSYLNNEGTVLPYPDNDLKNSNLCTGVAWTKACDNMMKNRFDRLMKGANYELNGALYDSYRECFMNKIRNRYTPDVFTLESKVPYDELKLIIKECACVKNIDLPKISAGSS